MTKLVTALVMISCVIGCGSGRGFANDGNDDAGNASNDDAAADSGSKTPKTDAGSPTVDASKPPGSPTLEIVSGSGGTVPSGWPATDPLRVIAKDGDGNPVANAVVSFAVGAGQSLHIQSYSGDTATTDATGIASVTYNAFPLDPNPGYEVDTVTASWNSLSVDFSVIITQVPSGAWAAPPLFYMMIPDTSPEIGEVKAGSTIKGAIQGNAVFQQGPSYGQGVPGWGFRLTKSEDLLNTAEVSCAGSGGTAIADATGNMSCDLVVPSTPGDYYFSMLAGGQIRWDGHLKAIP